MTGSQTKGKYLPEREKKEKKYEKTLENIVVLSTFSFYSLTKKREKKKNQRGSEKNKTEGILFDKEKKRKR